MCFPFSPRKQHGTVPRALLLLRGGTTKQVSFIDIMVSLSSFLLHSDVKTRDTGCSRAVLLFYLFAFVGSVDSSDGERRVLVAFATV